MTAGEIIMVSELEEDPRDLALVREAWGLLTKAETIDEIKDIRDKALAMSCYLQKRKASLGAQNTAMELAIHADFEAAIRWKDEPKNSGAVPQPSRFAVQTASAATAEQLGIAKHDISRWKALSTLTREDVDAYIEATRSASVKVSLRGLVRHAKRLKVRESPRPMAVGPKVAGNLREFIERGERFGTIYADPPWQYGNQGTRAATDDHYVTMTVPEICAEPVREVAAENAHLHLWTTNGFLREAFDVMEAWGFKYKSCFVWCKPQMGIGNYYRVSHEFLLFGVRGDCPFQMRDAMSWGVHDRLEHSRKPAAIREMVEKVSPGPYLEMYGRELRPWTPWSVYGNQVEECLLKLSTGT